MGEKTDYGVDAPGVIRNLLTIGAFACLLPLIVPSTIRFGHVVITGFHAVLWWTGIPLLLAGLLMLLYAKVGKFRHRDRMLALHTWTGSERVLDVGTGRGLLLVGAAKRLTDGHATGIDVWNREDLSGNAEQATLGNLQLEGVAERCTLVSEGAQKWALQPKVFTWSSLTCVCTTSTSAQSAKQPAERLRACSHQAA